MGRIFGAHCWPSEWAVGLPWTRPLQAFPREYSKYSNYQPLYSVDEGRSQSPKISPELSGGYISLNLLFLNKSTTSARCDFAQRVELKRCVLLGCVVLVLKLLLSSFINLKNKPWSTRCFFCLGFVVQQTGKGVFGGQIPLVLTHLCLFVPVSPFCAEKLGHLFFPCSGVLPHFLVFLSRENLHNIPKLCSVKLQGNGGGNWGFPPLQGGKLRTGREDGCDGPGSSVLSSLLPFLWSINWQFLTSFPEMQESFHYFISFCQHTNVCFSLCL